jgi:hypothetical protein
MRVFLQVDRPQLVSVGWRLRGVVSSMGHGWMFFSGSLDFSAGIVSCLPVYFQNCHQVRVL